MRSVLLTTFAFVTVASLVGCASSRGAEARRPDVVADMNAELAHTLPAEPVGTTTITSATAPKAEAPRPSVTPTAPAASSPENAPLPSDVPASGN